MQIRLGLTFFFDQPLRECRISIMRDNIHHLGQVVATEEEAAIGRAVEEFEFEIEPGRRFRLIAEPKVAGSNPAEVAQPGSSGHNGKARDADGVAGGEAQRAPGLRGAALSLRAKNGGPRSHRIWSWCAAARRSPRMEARHRISLAQFEAGRHYQALHEVAFAKAPHSLDLTAAVMDKTRYRVEAFSDQQQDAIRRLRLIDGALVLRLGIDVLELAQALLLGASSGVEGYALKTGRWSRLRGSTRRNGRRPASKPSGDSTPCGCAPIVGGKRQTR